MKNNFKSYYAIVEQCIFNKMQALGYEDDFLTIAFHHGRIIKLEELPQFLEKNKGKEFHYEKIELNDHCWEMCPECEEEVMLETKFEIQTCPSCGKPILPCNLCAGRCPTPCPLTKR